MTQDGAELIIFIAPQQHQLNPGCTLEKQIKRFNIHGTEDCIPDYYRFASSEHTSASEKVQELATKFGAEWVFNYPSSEKKSIFQEAFLKDDKETVKGVVNLAEARGIKLAGQWLPSSTEAEAEGLETEDLLMHSLKINAVGKAEEAMSFMMSKACPDQDVASMWSKNFTQALQSNPHRIIKALMKDEFIKNLSEMEVNADFLDPEIRRNTAVHVVALDDLLTWECEGNPVALAAKWKEKNLETIQKMEKNGKPPTAKALLYAVCIEGAILCGHKGLIRHLLLKGVPEYVFKSKAVKWIVLHKWTKVWRVKFMWKAGYHVAFLFFATAYAMVLGRTADLVNAHTSMTMSATLLLPFLWMYGIWTTIEETKQILSLINEKATAECNKWQGVRYYFLSKWNWVDIASCLLLVVLIPLFHILSLFIIQWNPALSAAVAIEILLAYIKVWYFAQPFRDTGALVLMIERIIKDCSAFFTLALIVLLGFALALHVMTRRITNGYKSEEHQTSTMGIDEIFATTSTNFLDSSNAQGNRTDDDVEDDDNADVVEAFNTFGHSILTLFYALFGQFEPSVFHPKNRLKWIIIPAFVTYMVTQVILMLNLLISIMGDTFDRVKCNEEGQMLMARAMIIDSCEASASKEEIEEIENKTGRYICALERVKDATEKYTSKTWTSRINMLVDKFKEIIRRSHDELKESVEKKVDVSQNAVTTVQREIREQLNASKEEVNALKDIIGEQDHKFAAMRDQLQQHVTEQSSALANLEARINQNSQDVSAKLETVLSRLENLTAT